MKVLIDGQLYTKQKQTFSIGIGITTHNRNALVKETLERIERLTPNAKIVVVDDASEQPVRLDCQVYRFEENVGIARAKNKCLELLSDVQHIFLFDDDTYPIKEDWFIPYITNHEPHLMYLFENWANGTPVGDDAIIARDQFTVAHKHARGCMLYIDRVVLETVGGMDTRYGRAMNEHLDWSNRIYNAGLTTHKYMDVVDSHLAIYSMDQHQEARSSIPRSARQAGLQNSSELLRNSETSSEYIPYGKDVVIACYFANAMDVQRGKAWMANLEDVRKLKESVEKKGTEFVLIHNCFNLPNKVEISGSPYFERWLKEWQYLRDHPEINNVFVVDATDVEMVNKPFEHMQKGVLYVGDENDTLSNKWMTAMHKEIGVNKFLRANPTKPLLNCGVVGGDRKTVMELLRKMYKYYFETLGADQTEMGVFNMLLYTEFAGRFEHGRKVTSVFKKVEVETNAWFRHK